MTATSLRPTGISCVARRIGFRPLPRRSKSTIALELEVCVMADESRISGPRRGGFTLIELMIVVAIVGILSATAIPNFRRFQLRSKSSEAKMNLGAIRTAEEAVLAEFGSYISAPASPASYGGRKATTFVDMGPVGGNFDTLGWRPEGQVFFQYSVTVESNAFTAEAAADIDGNGTAQLWGYLMPDLSTQNPIVGALGCQGVWDPKTSSATITRIVGPCSQSDGQSEF
jgi:type IV pilus assembly protein PilA